jgi:hypothetical protein
MNRNKYIFGSLLFAFILIFQSNSFGQDDKIRASLRASATQRIGVDTDITIDYSRPGVKGRNVWGDLVPFGLAPGNEYSKGNPYPWRAGANENTTIEFSTDVLIEGEKIAAGKYGLHMIPSEEDWIVIFSFRNSDWGSYSYDPAEDALRVTVTPEKAAYQEWLLFNFDDLSSTSATAYLHWYKLKVPFKISIE